MDWKRAIRQLTSRVDAMVTRAVINRVNEGLKTARLQVTLLDGEVEPDVELFGPFGFHMSPPEGAEAIALAVSGARSHTVVVATGAPGERPKDATARTGGMYRLGEWVLFVDDDGVVHIGAKEGAAFIARADLVKDELDKIAEAFNTFSPGSGGASFGTPYTTSSSVAATKGKVT